MESSLQSSEVRLPKTRQSPSCPQFKSTFARSLSFNQPNKPLDLEIYRVTPNHDTTLNHSQNRSGSSTILQLQMADNVDEDFEEFMRNSPLKKSITTKMSPPLRKNNLVALQNSPNFICSDHNRSQDTNKLCSAEIELINLRKEYQTLMEENRRLMNRNESNQNSHNQDVLLPTTANSVEEAVLQTQIETLQWQLNQVESSRQMYHALMEEVARFLERCYQSIETMQKNNKIARSRSINHMFIEQNGQSMAFSELRRISDIGSLRSNLNIAASDKINGNSTLDKDQLNDSFNSNITSTTSNSTESYNNFSDFTWRRSPKKSPQKGLNDDDAEKLSQEAFRLYRTAQNLLNLKEPTLSEPKPVSFHRNSLSDLKTSGCTMPSTFAATSTLQRKLKSRESHNSYQSSSTSDGSVHSNSSSIRTENGDDDLNGRNGNQLNLNGNRRSTNGIQISSSSSSSTIPNHQNNLKFNQISNLQNDMDAISIGKDRIKSVASSSADDESGFSSMNSFHHEQHAATMPMPPLATLNSTMLSNQLSLDDDNNKNEIEHDQQHPDIKTNLLPIIHKRYDSAPPIPPKKKLTTFTSLKNENSPETGGIHVLWV